MSTTLAQGYKVTAWRAGKMLCATLAVLRAVGCIAQELAAGSDNSSETCGASGRHD